MSSSAQRHGAPQRGFEDTPQSSSDSGRFGRMFRRLGAAEHEERWLVALAAAMVGEGADDDKPLGQPDDEENERIPSGYTYFGQFIDHDLTFDPVSSLLKQNDPDALKDFRTPSLDLDNVYGRGPDELPYRFRSGRGRAAVFVEGEDGDLPRAANGRAVIGDPRNDENQIVSQLHAVFLRFHNVIAEEWMPAASFAEVQREVRWHYQWAVVHDFLRRLAGDEVVDDILRPVEFRSAGESFSVVRPRLLFYEFRDAPFMPVEFSGAAYRLGHSMVRPSYHTNHDLKAVLEARAKKLNRGKTGNAVREPNRIPVFGPDAAPGRSFPRNLNGGGPRPRDQWIDWTLFLPGGEPAVAGSPQPSYQLDPEISAPLADLITARVLPASGGPLISLGARNLVRGLRLGLPSGQAIARSMGIPPVPRGKLGIDDRKGFVLKDRREVARAKDALCAATPLWFYVLNEARHVHAGRRLGPVGARIVAETIIGVLAGDPTSFLGVEPGWLPRAEWRASPGEFTLSDLVRVATRGTFRLVDRSGAKRSR